MMSQHQDKSNSKPPSPSPKTNHGKPKRPLSAYNLYYRFKRLKILEAQRSNPNFSKESIGRLISAVPGMEFHPASMANAMSTAQLQDLCRAAILSELRDNMSAKDTRNRSHRKSHGAMSFNEMNKIMCDSWRTLDEFSRSVFVELAEEGRRRYYRKRIEEYEEKYQVPALGRGEKKVDEAKPSPKKKARRTSSLAAAHVKAVRPSSFRLEKLPFEADARLPPKTVTKQQRPIATSPVKPPYHKTCWPSPPSSKSARVVSPEAPSKARIDLDDAEDFPDFDRLVESDDLDLGIDDAVDESDEAPTEEPDGEELGLLDPALSLPPFPDLFELHAMARAQAAAARARRRLPDLPLFSPEADEPRDDGMMARRGSAVSANDFLELINSLDESLS